MIGRLRGIVAAESPDGELIVDVQGVGYELRVPLGTMGKIAVEGDGIRTIFVHTAYKQDGVELYGFASLTDRAIFRALISVPNVGPKTALAILGSVQVSELAMAIDSGDTGRLSKVPGIGKKTAERMIVELRGKLDVLTTEPAIGGTAPAAKSANRDRIITALTNMGYRQTEAARAVEALGDNLLTVSLTEGLRDALGYLARR
jgi:holliday junction DNA helicase RuvA